MPWIQVTRVAALMYLFFLSLRPCRNRYLTFFGVACRLDSSSHGGLGGGNIMNENQNTAEELVTVALTAEQWAAVSLALSVAEDAVKLIPADTHPARVWSSVAEEALSFRQLLWDADTNRWMRSLGLR
jgi:hypothetical protein